MATRPAKKAPSKKAESTPKKKRVYEIAREFNLSSVAMVEQIRSLGFDIKNHMAVCTQEMFESVQKKFEEQRDVARQEMRRKSEQQKAREAKAVEEKKAAVAKKAPPKTVKKAKKTEAKPTRSKRRTEVAPIVETIEIRDDIPPPKRKKAKAKKAPVPTEALTERGPGRKRRRRRRGRPEVDPHEVAESVRRTMAQLSTGSTRSRRRRRSDSDEEEGEELEILTLKVNEFTTVGELSNQMDVRATEVITVCLQMGLMVTINQRLDMDTITLVAEEFGFEIEELEEFAEDVLEETEEDAPEDLEPRPPVVTIMGHVDHGKTSLLDYVRSTNVVAGEAGGITQHMGAYHVDLENGRQIAFLDTPGHEAFTAMRARGAKVTDVVVLVVAADDSVMPQTIEAIDHAKAAKVPIVVAINKTDLPTSNPDKIKRELTEHDVLVEDYGGNVQCCEISATTGKNVPALLELLALETDILELRANPKKRAKGTVVEAKLDRGRGNVATILVQEGTLRVGSPFVTGLFSGRVRAMIDERGHTVEEAGPSRPVQVLGLEGLPQAGDIFQMMESDRQAREISQKRQQLRREKDFHRIKRVSLTDIHAQIQAGKIGELRLILKGDVDGSVEALQDALIQITHEEVQLNIIHRGVGAISESDILLASASDAVIIGFNVRPDSRARTVAEREHVDIQLYRVIYEAVEDVKAALSGLLAPQVDEKNVGSAQVRELFQVPRAGTVAGCLVSEGSITRAALSRVVRDGVVAYEGRIGSLRRFKDDVRDVQEGFECGIGIENFNDVKVGDVIETYELVETSRTL